ncbi:flagellar biosynthesis protein FliR [Afifella pfennigii]|uniref:flagellar biosynthesis protein FliR n=1 Tax=Afifella pfennigii TaxID=209897 RepID=UPI00047B1BC5|nr:flagellar biosynthesis protein FliR [Afifella pfennigii]
MSAIGSETVLAVFLIFCRIGACLMLMPGFSSTRIPMRIRLFVALSVSLALSPLLVETVRPLVAGGSPGELLGAIGSELMLGFMIGLLGRLFFAALQFIAVAASQAMSLAVMPGLGIDDNEQVPPVASLFSLTAITIMFVTDQHWLLLGGLVDSYSTLAPARGFDVQAGLIGVTDQLADTFFLALRIGSPFIIYSVIINLAIGITNKLSPQIPVYFIAMPFVTAGGLILLMVTLTEFMANFIDAFGVWLTNG